MPRREGIARARTLRAAQTSPERLLWSKLRDGRLLLRDLRRDKVIVDVAAFIRDPAEPWPSGPPPMPLA
jgi:very-short-patch-repair endonuclease